MGCLNNNCCLRMAEVYTEPLLKLIGYSFATACLLFAVVVF